MSDFSVAVIGGGLSGLTACHLLLEAGIDAHIFETSDRLGGRIDSIRHSGSGEVLADLGPTWVWPVYQPNVAHWLDRLDVDTFPQFETGHAVLDMDPGAPPTRQFLPGQHGIARIDGGPQALVDQLADRIPRENTHRNHTLSQLESNDTGFALRFSENQIDVFKATHVIVAAPLRLAAESVDWSNLLDPAIISLMRKTPTWMATQAKALIVYKTPFWREEGLSGRVASRVGPLVEIHDHCGSDGSPAALFGFVGIPHQHRDDVDALKAAIIEQLVRCFGQKAAEFEQFEVKDWATDHHICSNTDLETDPAHPETLPDAIRQGFFDNRLFFACAETATQSPGLIDGAFEAGERVAQQIIASRS